MSEYFHNQRYGQIGNSSYTLDFYSGPRKNIIDLNMVLYHNGEEYLLENVISGGNNDLYGTLKSLDIDDADIADIITDVMKVLGSENFEIPDVVFE